jgi:hypothetical protein
VSRLWDRLGLFAMSARPGGTLGILQVFKY